MIVTISVPRYEIGQVIYVIIDIDPKNPELLITKVENIIISRFGFARVYYNYLCELREFTDGYPSSTKIYDNKVGAIGAFAKLIANLPPVNIPKK